MKKEEKRIIVILLIVVVLVIGGLLFWRWTIEEKIQENSKGNSIHDGNKDSENKEKEKYVSILEDGTKLNISSKLKETKKIEGIEISNIQLTYKKGQTILLAEVENKSGKNIDLTKIEILLYDDTGKEIKKLNGLISPIKAGEKTQLNIGTQEDYANTYDIKVVKK